MSTLLKYRSIILLFVVAIVCSPIYVMAQPGFDPGVPDGAPVDGGLSMLVVAGVVYGTNKFLNKKKKAGENKEENTEK